MKTNDTLKSYREKRDFRRTPEPAGTGEDARAGALFVVQKHDARKHHYDLRLEVNNVLKSWAVPKGPSNDPAEKRLAIATEDHPLEYAKFEGVIPKGEYGAGKMIVWDTGTYRNITTKAGQSIPIEDAIEHGHVSFQLNGQKLRGGFALNRFRVGRQEQWLLVKMQDEEADPGNDPRESRPESVLSGRKIEDIGADRDRESSGRIDRAASLTSRLTGKSNHGSDPMPSHIEPMLAMLSKTSRSMKGYSFEYKWDGIRVLCYWDGTRMKLESRKTLDITHRWPELAELADVLGSTAAVLDGEIVALDSNNRVSFGLLSRRMHLSSKPTAAQMRAVPIVYMIFDILYLKDRSLMDLSYADRRSILTELNFSSDKWQAPEPVPEEPEVILEAAIENGMEGLVAKKLGSPYRPGQRTRDWLKIKAMNRQELVIGGWIPVKGSIRQGVGSLLLGYYDDDNRLVFAGKVGTGFTDAARKDLKKLFDGIRSDTSSFATDISDKDVIFLEPQTVAEIEFREWTEDGRLRQPSFKGLREDKDPHEVVRESTR